MTTPPGTHDDHSHPHPTHDQTIQAAPPPEPGQPHAVVANQPAAQPHHDGHESDGHDHDHDHSHAHTDEHSSPHADHDHAPARTAPPHPGVSHGHDTHGHDHDHEHEGGWLASFFQPHSHDHSDLAGDSVLEGSQKGIRALQLSLIGLGLTAAFQVVIVLISGSVALLADTIHNFGDALTAIPLWVAFWLNQRPHVAKGYTYRYGRAEDLAGVFIVVAIAFSALVVFWEAWQKFSNPEPMTNLGWVALASLIGFVGNEAVAWLRISTGREIGSAALIADGIHARTDGLTSLAVLVGVFGVWLGFPLADPLVGVLIGIAIVFILRDSAQTMWRRLMDAVEPELLDKAQATAQGVAGVQAVDDLRLRWLGHSLWCELRIEVDGQLSTIESHHIAEEVRHALFHELPRLKEITVHVDPAPTTGDDPHHEVTAHHRQKSPQAQPAPAAS
jgi:cation diffusion facilitator family transporter